jgi:hypothetical protein
MIIEKSKDGLPLSLRTAEEGHEAVVRLRRDGSAITDAEENMARQRFLNSSKARLNQSFAALQSSGIYYTYPHSPGSAYGT